MDDNIWKTMRRVCHVPGSRAKTLPTKHFSTVYDAHGVDGDHKDYLLNCAYEISLFAFQRFNLH